MTHIICRAATCVFWDQGICSAEEIEYDPDEGCRTYQDLADLGVDEIDEDGDLYWDAKAGGSPYDDEEDDEDWDDDWDEDEDDDEDDEDDDLDF